MYTKTARREGFRFFGGVELGTDISRAELRERYHAVVYAVGTADDNRLGIPGEDRPGSYPATRFVAWYNGHPHACDDEFDLSARRAPWWSATATSRSTSRACSSSTPTSSRSPTPPTTRSRRFARPACARSSLLGRRGPAQAAFTKPELRELGELTRADIDVDPADLELDAESPRGSRPRATRRRRRNVELLRDYAAREPHGHSHRVSLRFLRSPVEILGEGDDGRVTGVRVVRNRIERGDDGRLRAVPTGEEEVIECGLVLRSIGYRGRPLDDIPFDERRGLIRNAGGRVCDEDGEPLPGEYAVGWIKRGPCGVIGTNKKDATDTVARILEDAEAGRLPEPAADADAAAVGAWLRDAAPGRRRVGRLAGDRRARARPGRARRAARASSSSGSPSWSRPAAAAGGRQGRRSLNAAIARSTASGSSNSGCGPRPRRRAAPPGPGCAPGCGRSGRASRRRRRSPGSAASARSRPARRTRCSTRGRRGRATRRTSRGTRRPGRRGGGPSARAGRRPRLLARPRDLRDRDVLDERVRGDQHEAGDRW